MRCKSYSILLSLFVIIPCTHCAPEYNSYNMSRISKQKVFKITVQNKNYDYHRPDGVTALVIEIQGWPGNTFGLWLPENIDVNNGYVWTNWKDKDVWPDWMPGDVYQNWEKGPDGSLRWKKSFEEFDFMSELVPDEDNFCIWYRHRFTNTSNSILRELNANACFHLSNAPQFISVTGERYWACIDGKWTTSDKAPREKSPDPRRIGFLREGLRSERTVVPNYTFPSAMMPQHSSHPLIIAESFDGKASVGIAARHFHDVWNNNDSILRCLHSNSEPIEILPPGETKIIEGVIIFYEGNHKDLLAHYEATSKKKWN